jgi:hypothetical protein
MVPLLFLKLLAYTLQFNILYILTDEKEVTEAMVNGNTGMFRSIITAEKNPFMLLQWDAVNQHVEILFHDVRNPTSHLVADKPDIGSDMSLSPFKIYYFAKVDLLRYDIKTFFGDLLPDDGDDVDESILVS